jgi:hypothetical protein
VITAIARSRDLSCEIVVMISRVACTTAGVGRLAFAGRVSRTSMAVRRRPHPAGTLTSLTTKVITQALSGARVTDFVSVAPLAALPTGVVLGSAYVSAAGVISIRFANVTTADVAGGNVSLMTMLHKFST